MPRFPTLRRGYSTSSWVKVKIVRLAVVPLTVGTGSPNSFSRLVIAFRWFLSAIRIPGAEAAQLHSWSDGAYDTRNAPFRCHASLINKSKFEDASEMKISASSEPMCACGQSQMSWARGTSEG